MKNSQKFALLGLLCAAWAAAIAQNTPTLPVGQIAPTTSPKARVAADAAQVQVRVLASGLEHPWGLALLPDGRFLVTERPGRMRIVEANGRVGEPLAGVPAVYAQGQGGFLDLALDPQFASNQLVYFSYAEADASGAAGTALARAKLQANALADVQVIFRQSPKTRGALHFGPRIVFQNDNTLWLALGDRYTHKDSAQDTGTTLGKIVRIHTDGRVPADNPYLKVPSARPELWSIGHRNIQAAARHPDTGQLWTVEHGAQGGDEVNNPQPGNNHGWPLITYGTDYGGAKIGSGVAAPGLQQPVHYFDPSIAPSGAAFYSGNAFPSWRGDLLVGALRGTHLARLSFKAGRVVAEQRYLSDRRDRIRDVRVGADGHVYLLTDHPAGKLLRLRPTSP